MFLTLTLNTNYRQKFYYPHRNIGHYHRKILLSTTDESFLEFLLVNLFDLLTPQVY